VPRVSEQRRGGAVNKQKFVCRNNKRLVENMSMYQAVLSRQDSSLVTLSSDDAKEVDATYGNGKFKCNLMNTNRGGTHAIKIVPNLVMVPNVFNNVYTGMNQLDMYFAYSPIESITVPYGFYTRDEFVDMYNSLGGGFIIMSVTVDGYIQLLATLPGDDSQLFMVPAMANMLGFTDRTLFPFNGTHVDVGILIVNGSTVVANTRPHMGTTPVVYVTTRQFGINRMIASNNRDYNVIATVSMHDVPYGSYGVFRGVDVFMDDIEFRSPRSLDQVDVELLDSNYNTLTIDPRFEVILQLKVFHTDTTK
jgi:hypothetical protein